MAGRAAKQTYIIYTTDGEMKWCPDCQNYRPVSEFSKRYGRRTGLSSYCRKHTTERRLKFRESHIEKEKQTQNIWYHKNKKRLQLSRRISSYGITAVQFFDLLNYQNNKCAICNEPFENSKNTHIDHDHKCCSGKRSCGKCIRSLLCQSCNWILGQLEKRLPMLVRCAPFYKYVERHKLNGITTINIKTSS